MKLLSGFGSAISMKPPRGQMCSAPGSSAKSPRAVGRDRELLVAVVEQLLVRLDRAGLGERAAHLGARAVGREHDVDVERRARARGLDDRVAARRVDVDAARR